MIAKDSEATPRAGAAGDPGTVWAVIHFRRVRKVAGRLGLIGAVAALLTGLAGLAGALFALPALATLGIVEAPVSALESAGLVGAGLSLLLALPEAFRPRHAPAAGRSRRWRGAALGLAGLTGLAALIRLALLVAGGKAAGIATLGQAVILLLLGAALLAWRTRRHLRASQAATALAGLGSWFLLLTGAYGSPPGPAGSTPGLSLAAPTGILLAAGILALRPFEGWMRLAIAAHLAGRLLRRLVPVALLLPLAMAVLRLVLTRNLPLPSGAVMAGVTLTTVLGLVWISLANALAIDSLDRQRRRQELRAERSLAEAGRALARAQVFFEGAPGCMLVIGEDGRIESLNGQAEQVFGWPRPELLGQPLWRLAAPGREGPWRSLVEGAAAPRGQEPDAPLVELACQRADGRQFGAEAGFRASLRGGHRLVVVHLRDISARQRSEQELAQREQRLRESKQALRESEERFRLAFESAGIGMALVAPGGRWLKVNRALCLTLGLTADELLARSSPEVTHPDDRAKDEALVGSVLAGHLKTYQRSKRYFHASGRVVWALVTVALVRDAEERPLYFVSLIEDITQRRETEGRVKTLHEQLRGILEFSPSLVTLFDLEGRYLLVSRSVENALSRPAAEIIGRPLEEVVAPALAGAMRARLARIAAERRPFVVEDISPRPGGEHTYLTTLFPLFDGDGRHVASGLVATDITEQCRAQRLAEGAVREKDILVQEIHHRVKNNLQIISSLLQMESRAVADPVARERFEDCRSRVQAMALIHERLYRAGDLSCIDLGPYLESLAGQIIRSFGRVPEQVLQRVEVTVGPVGIELAVPCGLIVAELVTNAMKHAFPDQRRGELVVRLAPAGAGWELSVADNGVGGPPKPAGPDGESLGLKLVAALARQLGGTFTVARGAGITVKVTFPAPMTREKVS